MSRRERYDGDRRPGERRDGQPDDEQQRRPGDEVQEGDSLTALKAILAKVAALLAPLQLSQDESISLVEQLYGSVLDMDVKLAGETDDKRKSSILAHIQNTSITRSGGKIAVEYPTGEELKAAAQKTPSSEPVTSPEPVTSESPAPEAAPETAEPAVGAEDTATDES